jgi:hypothetical protein
MHMYATNLKSVVILICQVDNQTAVGPPVLLSRCGNSLPPASATAQIGSPEAAPALHISIVRRLDMGLSWYRYLAAAVQEMKVHLIV